MTAVIQKPISQLKITWPLLPDDFILPDDPVDDTDHPLLAHGLRQSVVDSPELIQDALIVSNFALCAAVDDRTICKAPDWMYVRPVQPWPHSYPRRSYTPHTEGTVPFVVMEFLSATYGDEYSVEHTEEIGKWFFYEQVIKVPRYVIFRPPTGKIEVYALESERYDNQNPDENGRYLIPGLNLFLGVWEGTREGRTGSWLRWWNAGGELLLWPEERAKNERQRAENERQRADRQQQDKELAETLLEQERQRNQELLARLAALGIDPE
ncbi:Uma2 family endonuclease [Tychonema sp. LEGE 07203]|uniref:Uma2 family endonuclease n=1 Tax=Tychonema sp. LEGE 07203 TaxID=1828671 RepID=UPI0018801E15|nr:Uma2 family endonuclease [Tychonema sp. LEGE 07203]MBE9094264.1 Uma2 family endonuclease [Tychonema sp. LEGE 07203]